MSGNVLGKKYAPGDVVIIEGERGDCMFMMQSGSVEVVKDGVGGASGGSGGSKQLAILSRGDFFGEMALFEDEVRSATVRALEESIILKIDKRTLLKRIQEDPVLALKLVKKLCGRIRTLSTEVST